MIEKNCIVCKKELKHKGARFCNAKCRARHHKKGKHIEKYREVYNHLLKYIKTRNKTYSVSSFVFDFKETHYNRNSKNTLNNQEIASITKYINMNLKISDFVVSTGATPFDTARLAAFLQGTHLPGIIISKAGSF